MREGDLYLCLDGFDTLVLAPKGEGLQVVQVRIWTPSGPNVSERYTYAGRQVSYCEDGIGLEEPADVLYTLENAETSEISFFNADGEVLAARWESDGLYSLETRTIILPGDVTVFNSTQDGDVYLGTTTTRLVAQMGEECPETRFVFAENFTDPEKYIYGPWEVYVDPEPDQPTSKSSGWSTGATIGLVAGVVVIVLIVALAWLYKKRKEGEGNGGSSRKWNFRRVRSLMDRTGQLATLAYLQSEKVFIPKSQQQKNREPFEKIGWKF